MLNVHVSMTLMRVKNQHLSNGAPSPNSKPSASIVGILNVGNNLWTRSHKGWSFINCDKKLNSSCEWPTTRLSILWLANSTCSGFWLVGCGSHLTMQCVKYRSTQTFYRNRYNKYFCQWPQHVRGGHKL